jgi:hypothetical protein
MPDEDLVLVESGTNAAVSVVGGVVNPAQAARLSW